MIDLSTALAWLVGSDPVPNVGGLPLFPAIGTILAFLASAGFLRWLFGAWKNDVVAEVGKKLAEAEKTFLTAEIGRQWKEETWREIARIEKNVREMDGRIEAAVNAIGVRLDRFFERTEQLIDRNKREHEHTVQGLTSLFTMANTRIDKTADVVAHLQALAPEQAAGLLRAIEDLTKRLDRYEERLRQQETMGARGKRGGSE